MVMAKIHAAVRMISRFDRDSLIFCTCLLPAVRAGLLARFLLTGLGWWGARKRGVPLPCVTSAYTTSSHALQRSVTSLRPTTSTPVHEGLPRLRIPQRRSAFFPERNSPFLGRGVVHGPECLVGDRKQ